MTPVLAISSGTIAAIVVIGIVDLFAIVFGLSFARARREERAAQAAATAAALGQPAPTAPRPVSRREFFRRSLIASVLLYAAQFGGATIAFLWPSLKGGQWFECPCHGSKYNSAGEYKLGPAPRGMDRFHVEVTSSGDVMVDTSEVILGPPRGTDTLHRPQAGPFCVAPG
jgi:hypothetical protein